MEGLSRRFRTDETSRKVNKEGEWRDPQDTSELTKRPEGTLKTLQKRLRRPSRRFKTDETSQKEPSRRFGTDEMSRKDPQDASKLTKRLGRTLKTLRN
ncbi:unnamed protein product [Rhizophagus irregularis]|nr:unnamed protein product [Rhizophagus irregularis]